MPLELHYILLQNFPPGLALSARSVCKFWDYNLKTPSILDHYFLLERTFEYGATTDSYYLSIEPYPTVHHFCLAKGYSYETAVPKRYDDAYIYYVEQLIERAVQFYLPKDREDEFRDFILELETKQIYCIASNSLYLQIDDDFGIGIMADLGAY